MKPQTIIQDYYGGSNFIERNQEKEITIFIVDDNKVYLSLLKNSLKRKNFSVLTFTTGEECLDYLELKPELIILDYHLDGVNPYAKKGDKISELIKEQLPDTEIILMSSDKKFKFISSINFSRKVIFKDGEAVPKMKNNVDSVIELTKEKNDRVSKTKVYVISALIFITFITSLLFYFFIE